MGKHRRHHKKKSGRSAQHMAWVRSHIGKRHGGYKRKKRAVRYLKSNYGTI